MISKLLMLLATGFATILLTAATTQPVAPACKCHGYMRLDLFVGWNSFNCFNVGQACDSGGTCNEISSAQPDDTTAKSCKCVTNSGVAFDPNCNCTLGYPGSGQPTCTTITACPPTGGGQAQQCTRAPLVMIPATHACGCQ